MTRRHLSSRRQAAKPVPVPDEAVVTSIVPYGEADLVVRLFTAERGRLGAFARGAKKSQRRFGGLTAPARARVGLVERAGSDLFALEEIDVDPALFGLSADVRAFGYGSYAVELVERLVPELLPVPELFSLLDATLRSFARHGADARLLRAYELKLLALLGYLPDLSGPEDEPGEPVRAFDPASFHLLAHEGPGTIAFDEAARRAGLLLLEADVALGPEALPAVDEPSLRALARVFAAHLRRQGQQPLKSVAFLRSLAPHDA